MIIATNWKAYVEDPERAKKLVSVAKRLARSSTHDIILGPPTPFFALATERNTSPVQFAAQDVSASTGGAKTGENTAQMFAAAGATYAIAGHSERRAAGDTNDLVAEKISHIVAQGLRPIVCIGEKERDEAGRYLTLLREEIAAALEPLNTKNRSQIILAYEPIWAIGKRAADAMHADEVAEMVLYIRKVLAEYLPGKASSRIPILYGGSVEADNIRDLAAASGVDGFLIGHASADPDTFTKLIHALR